MQYAKKVKIFKKKNQNYKIKFLFLRSKVQNFQNFQKISEFQKFQKISKFQKIVKNFIRFKNFQKS